MTAGLTADLFERFAWALTDLGEPDAEVQQPDGLAPCGLVPDVPRRIVSAAFSLRGGTGAEGGAAFTGCMRPPHTGQHHSLLRHLGAIGQGVWLFWQGPSVLMLVLPDCPGTEDGERACPLFFGHEGHCPR
ncbi:hypothetical protein [Streptomyces catenulae]|uniref:Uncharacterized protein n=1 Tax=Streptomyces catenulae TaxID=66875 RepID=A0ABV2YTI4_9ACTN|nr:hypothetical protein [Streptomyces catenulae]